MVLLLQSRKGMSLLQSRRWLAIPTLDQANATKALAFIRTEESCVAIDVALLQKELVDCGAMERDETIRCIIYWLAVRCKLGYEFITQIVEVSTPLDGIDWRTPEWLVAAIHTYSGTCIRHTT